MKEVIVHVSSEVTTEIHESSIPVPKPDEVVIKVIVAGSNPKDWQHPRASKTSLNSGDDIAGIVHLLGSNVQKTNEFRIGDRVAAFHPMGTAGGAFAEYAVSPQHTVFKIPEGTSFEEAATIPLVVTTSAIALFRRQHLPPPWSPIPADGPPTPLIIYGASGAVGTFSIKLARAANIHPIIAIAGSSSAHLLPLLDESKGDALVDYRIGVEEMKKTVHEKLGGLPCHNSFDTISANGTWIPISHMLSPSGSNTPSYLSVVSGSEKYDDEEIKENVEIVYTFCGTAHTGKYRPGAPKTPADREYESDPEWAFVFFKYISRMLADGRLTGHPFEVVDGGLEGVGKGLNMLKEGRAKGVKYVFKVSNE